MRHPISTFARRPSRLLCARLAIITCLAVVSVGCGSAPSRDTISQFRDGTSATAKQTAQALADANTILRACEVDRAVGQPALNETEFTAPLAADDLASWTHAFTLIDAYAAALEKLLDPQTRTDAQQNLVGLGDAIGKMDKKQLPVGLESSFATFGGLLQQMNAEHDAMVAIAKVDPGMQNVFTSMMNAIGPTPDDGVRRSVRTCWETKLGAPSNDFKWAKSLDEKRKLVEQFTDLMNQRDAQDSALADVHRAIGQIAAAHHQLATGKTDSAAGLLDLVQREYSAYTTEHEAIDKQRQAAKDAKKGGPQ